MDFFYLSIAIALFGFFIGDGIKNFNKPESKNFLDSLMEDENTELIPKREVHHYIGIKREDVDALIEKYPHIPYIKLNDSVYFHRKKLMKWLENMN